MVVKMTTKNLAQKQENNIEELKTLKKSLGSDMPCTEYSLWRLNIKGELYLMIIRDEKERAVMFIGENESEASAVFDRFIKENVLVCTAYDIYRDMLEDKKTKDNDRKNTLQIDYCVL